MFIRSLGHALGEEIYSAERLAATHGISRDSVLSSLGDKQVFVTRRTRFALEDDAMARCLASGGQAAAELDLVVECAAGYPVERGMLPPGVRVGASRSPTMLVLARCAAVGLGFALAERYLRAGDIGSVLLVHGAVWLPEGDPSWRMIGAATEDRPKDFLSDGACAVLLSASQGMRVCGVGSVVSNQYWEFERRLERQRRGESIDAPPEVRVLLESIGLCKTALARCLAQAGILASAIDHITFAAEAAHLPPFLLRHLGLPLSKLYTYPGEPAHTGSSDPTIGLEVGLREGAFSTGQLVLLGWRANAAAAFVLVRI